MHRRALGQLLRILRQLASLDFVPEQLTTRILLHFFFHLRLHFLLQLLSFLLYNFPSFDLP